jgi:hypothetical protein
LTTKLVDFRVRVKFDYKLVGLRVRVKLTTDMTASWLSSTVCLVGISSSLQMTQTADLI